MRRPCRCWSEAQNSRLAVLANGVPVAKRDRTCRRRALAGSTTAGLARQCASRYGIETRPTARCWSRSLTGAGCPPVPAKHSIPVWPSSPETNGTQGATGQNAIKQSSTGRRAGRVRGRESVAGLENNRRHGRPAAAVGAREPGCSDGSSGGATILVMETADVRESEDLAQLRGLRCPGLRALFA